MSSPGLMWVRAVSRSSVTMPRSSRSITPWPNPKARTLGAWGRVDAASSVPMVARVPGTWSASTLRWTLRYRSTLTSRVASGPWPTLKRVRGTGSATTVSSKTPGSVVAGRCQMPRSPGRASKGAGALPASSVTKMSRP